ncbi:MAG: FAD-dependent oxidoreductase [candidate division WOR-3 bacterium]
MMDVGRHPNITLYTLSEVTEVKGEAGNFTAKIVKHPRYVDISKCTACGDCTKVCPMVVPNEFDLGLKSRKAIYTPYNQAVPSAYVRVREECLDNVPDRARKIAKRLKERREKEVTPWELIVCGKCIQTCKAKAINFDEPEEEIELNVGAIVVATGVEYYDPREASEYGYTRFENVVTSFELERLLDAASPTRGELLTFANVRPPKRIAFIQCVGSRNMKADIDYCSRICCMNTIKDTLVVREHYPDAEIMVFYIDIRAFGKGFEEFYRRSLDAGVKYIKGKPSKITEDKKTGEIILSYEDQLSGEIKHMVVDLAVLSSAMVPSPATRKLSQILGVELARDGFFKEIDPCSHPLESPKPGIYLCGCATGPKDITDAIAEASGAAVKAGMVVKEEIVEEKKEEVKPLDLSGPPRVGVFVCHCGTNIAAVIDIKQICEYTKTLKDVVFVEDYLFACAESVQKKIQEAILQYNLNRIVVAACTPKTHEGIFQETLSKIGFNPYLFDMANIRNQCSWVHQQEPEKATEKAKEIIKMYVERVKKLESLYPKTLNVGRDVLVIGGGVTGIQCAIDLANRGLKVYLIEKEEELGGRVRKLASVYPTGKSGKDLIKELLGELENKDVTVFTNAEIKDIKGFVGNFEIELICSGRVYSANKGSEVDSSKDNPIKLNVGAIILAIGADLYKPLDKFGYGQYPNVYTSMELEEMISNNSEKIQDIKSVAFIQCVGSRAEFGNTWCSRYCCQSAIKHAITLRERGIDVTIFHRGIRVYTKGAELMYRKAREMGVLFIPYSELAKGEIPEVIGNARAEQVEMYYDVIGKTVVVPVDAVFLSVGMVPNGNETMKLSDLLKVPRGSDLFFLERHSKFGPVETTVEGVFLAGCCMFPMDIGDSVAQASAVAAKVSALLSRDIIVLPPITSEVNELYCRGCGRCTEVCEFHAISLLEKEPGIFVAKVNEAMCKGCGTCVPACPTGAIDLRYFKFEQIKAQLEALFE